MAAKPLGIRLNNPMNVERTGQKWLGLAKVQGHPRFFTFIDPWHGIRCGARILTNYQKLYGLDTVRSLITRWAPPVENATSFYITHVGKGVGVGIDTRLDLSDLKTLYRLCQVMVLHENGEQPFAPELIRSACLSALGRKSA